MELVIPGLILVALMVYVSTRIKKATVKAFERESIETEDLSLIKPEGFLHLINSDPKFVFQAYSKEFGTEGASERRQATIDIRKVADKTLDQIYEDLKHKGKIVDDKSFQLDEMSSRSIEIEQDPGGADIVDHYLLVQAPTAVFEMRTVVLKEYNDDYLRKIAELEKSLTIKK
jgi:hypothetical protein